MERLLSGLGLLLIVSIWDISLGFQSAWAYDLPAAQTALKAKDYERVVQLLSPAVDKLNREGLFALAKAYSALKKPEAAIKAYSACLTLNSKDFEAKTLIGAEQMASKKDREALASLREALEINPKYVPAYRLLAQYYQNKGHKYEERLLYEDLIAKVGETADAITKLCELTVVDRLYDLAFKYCQKGIFMDPKRADNFVNLGIAYKETGDPEKAEANLKKAATDFPKSNFAQMSYAQFLDERKNFLTSYVYYKKAVASDPKSVPSWLGLGNSSLEIQKYADSLEAFQKACSLDRKTRPSFRKASIQLRTMKMDDWHKKFEQGLEGCG